MHYFEIYCTVCHSIAVLMDVTIIVESELYKDRKLHISFIESVVICAQIFEPYARLKTQTVPY